MYYKEPYFSSIMNAEVFLFTVVYLVLELKVFHCENGGFHSRIEYKKAQPREQNILHYADTAYENLQDLKHGLLYNLATLPRLSGSINGNIKDSCLNDTEKLIEDLLSKEMYAVKFLDADGKMPAGVLQGGKFWVGDYQQCNSIVSSYNNFTNHSFKGQYFTVSLSITGGILESLQQLIIGICLPDSCDISDSQTLAEVVITSLKLPHISVAFTADDKKPDLDGAAIVTIVLLSIIGACVVLGTSLDLYTEARTGQFLSKNGEARGLLSEEPTERTSLLANSMLHDHYVLSKTDKFIGFLLCFSFIRNTKKLFNTGTANGPLGCLNGLRVISMWWVIQGHTYELSTPLLDNPLYAYSTVIQRFTFQPIQNGTFSVDTFFFLSGLLVAYIALKEQRDKGKIYLIYYFLHRYWRLTPLYAIVLLIFTSLTVYMISGPFHWFFADSHSPIYEYAHGCRNYWWSNLLYINNFYPNYGDLTACMGWGWYLANDMQFYIFLSPILIILFRYHKGAAIVTSVSLVLVCVAIRGFLVSYYGLRGFAAPTEHTDDPWAKHGVLYVRPWARMSPYIIGFLTGYILHKKHCRVQMNKVYVVIGWCLSIGMALSTVYGLYYYYSHPETKMPMVASGFYVSLCRTAWSLSLAWLVVACASGYGGPVNWLLSWKVWAPLGRLTFAAYLVHPIIVVLYNVNSMTPIHFTDLTLIYTFISNVVFSYSAAYVLSMVVEAPMMAIEKLILNKNYKQ